MEGVKEEQTELKMNPGLRKRWSRGRKPTPLIKTVEKGWAFRVTELESRSMAAQCTGEAMRRVLRNTGCKP